MIFRKDNIVNPPAPFTENFGLWLTSGIFFQSGAPGVEDFSLWLTLDKRTVPCPSRKSLSLGLDVHMVCHWSNTWTNGHSLAPRGGLCHFGLVKHMVGHWSNTWTNGLSLAPCGGLCHFGLVKHMVGHWSNTWTNGQSLAPCGGLCHFGLVGHMVGHLSNIWLVIKTQGKDSYDDLPPIDAT